MDLYIYHVRSLNCVVKRELIGGTIDYRDYNSTRGRQKDIEFDNALFKLQPLKTEIFELGPSKRMVLRNYHKEEEKFVILRSSSDKILYELVDDFWTGLNLVSREESYKKVYIVYEQLAQNVDDTLRAVRHGISHSRSHLTHKKTTNILKTLFEDVKIDFRQQKNVELFNKVKQNLYYHTHSLLIDKVINELGDKKIDKYYLI